VNINLMFLPICEHQIPLFNYSLILSGILKTLHTTIFLNCNNYLFVQSGTEISTLILTSNRTRHDEQFFYVPFFPNRQFCLAFPPIN
jgi:hypothetical protein